MNDYTPTSRPAVFGMLAVTLAAITIGLTVVLPASMHSAQEPLGAAAPQGTAPAAVDADAGRMHIEVTARRSTVWTTVHNRLGSPRPDHQASDRPAARGFAS